jgi:hypothetical protein
MGRQRAGIWRAGLAVAIAVGTWTMSARATSFQANSCDITAPGRVVAVGDAHGAFDKYVSILREAKLLDARQRWIGGNAVLVQVGDVVDRGNDSRKLLDLIRRLEGEARKTGGQVVFLLGNHEVMRMAGDWRYVSAADFESFKSPDAGQLRDRMFEDALAAADAAAKAKGDKLDAKDFRKTFYEKNTLGSAEMHAAFAESGEYGEWLRRHDIMARINGVVFAHAGPNRTFAERGCAGLNADAHVELKALNLADPNIKKTTLWSPDGPLWYRGLVGVDPAASPEDVKAILASLGATRIVVGHTATTPGRIRSLQGGSVIAIDSGMLGGELFPNGVPSALEIDKGTVTAIYIGKREVLTTLDPAGTIAIPVAARR